MKTLTLMQMAYLISQESTCCSWKVGALITKDDAILGMGYNGTPHGQEHCVDHAVKNDWGKRVVMESGCIGFQFEDNDARTKHSAWSSMNEVHAEQNAIFMAAKNGHSVKGATMYVTLSPCPRCVAAIIQSGISTLIYSETYDANASDWAKPLTDAGIRVKKLDTVHLTKLDWSRITNEPMFVNN